MRRLLMRSIPVNVRKNLATYILLTILVMTGMYIASAMAGITYSYDTAYEEKIRVSNSIPMKPRHLHISWSYKKWDFCYRELMISLV